MLGKLISNFEKSNRYRERVHHLIPGGAHTYSKGDDQFPILSPAAIDRGYGSHIWDIDNNRYLDCAMGLTSVSLGHAYPPVLERVKKELERGVNFQRPSRIELEMAEAFVDAIPHHDMIKFTKNGSTATTVAIKIARAATGRNLVAFPSDHPFYSYDDWFIGKSACNLGVPSAVQELSVTFNGCDLSSLEALFEEFPNQIACVITEPQRPTCRLGCACNGRPQEFIRKAIALCHAHGAYFILDEMITGYKVGFPGAISSYDLKPDLATWGKGIANGFSFCALTGIRELMDLGGILQTGKEKLFLASTTHGGETHSIGAALATLEVFRTENVVSANHSFGRSIHELVAQLVRKHGLREFIEVIACDWMPGLVFRDSDRVVSQGMRTLVMQEMISRGVLFQGFLTPCFSHTAEDLDFFQKALDETLAIYVKALDMGFEHFLEGPPAKPVFRKYL